MNLQLIVLVGASGAGKTTLGKMIAEKCNYVHLGEDDFVFEMIPLALKQRKLGAGDREIGMRNLWSCIENCLKAGRSVVVEGALVDGPFYLDDFKELAVKHGAEYIPFLLSGTVAKRRLRKLRQGYAVTREQDKRLRDRAKQLRYTEKCTVVDTTKLTKKRVFEQLMEKIVH
ncbi:AAA family ATPase [Candidatus Saccharibacteria bacterium]|nr:AAA family ATPase [Candidatus Saccharibacteria bacterium]